MISTNQRAWVFTNHSPNEIFSGISSIKEDDLVVAVDAGLRAVQHLGLQASVLIGDMDSLDESPGPQDDGLACVTHDPRKNETDTELAVVWCKEQGCSDIIICNDLEGRFDHALGIIQVIYSAHLEALRCRVESKDQQVFFLPPLWRARDMKGYTLSLISWSSTARLESSLGLEYPLDGLVLRQHKSRGISNVIISDDASIRLSEGQVLAVITKF